MTKQRFLMCRPDFFDVEYIINPHMIGNINKVNKQLARDQWEVLYTLVSGLADVELISQVSGLPDMVFTANGGFLFPRTKVFVVSDFKNEERRQESPLFAEWATSNGYSVIVAQNNGNLPRVRECYFEGEGDCLYQKDRLWCGYGQRSAINAAAFSYAVDPSLIHYDTVPNNVINLRLVNPKIYHLDIALCPINDEYVMYYPESFDAVSQNLIKKHVPEKFRIAVTREEAESFICNSIAIGNILIMPYCSERIRKKLLDINIIPAVVSLSEFQKAGGAAKCLILNI